MLEKTLIRIDVEANSSEEALNIMADLFLKEGIVKKSYAKAIIEREKEYPTGLPTAAFDIAIPHTFAEHVIRPAVGICLLKKPVKFQQMGSPDITLYPQVLFMLAITDPKDQLKLLQKISQLIQNVELLNAIKNSTSSEEVFELVNPYLVY